MARHKLLMAPKNVPATCRGLALALLLLVRVHWAKAATGHVEHTTLWGESFAARLT